MIILIIGNGIQNGRYAIYHMKKKCLHNVIIVLDLHFKLFGDILSVW